MLPSTHEPQPKPESGIKAIRSWIRLVLTGRDNKTPDIVRILAALMGLQFMGLSTISVVAHGHPFDPMSYGSGAAAILAAIGAAIFMKKHEDE